MEKRLERKLYRSKVNPILKKKELVSKNINKD